MNLTLRAGIPLVSLGRMSLDRNAMAEGIAIASKVREALGIKKGEKVIFETNGKTITVRKANAMTVTRALEEGSKFGDNAIRIVRQLRDEWH